MNAPRFASLQPVLAAFFSTLVFASHAQTLPDKPVVKGKFLGDGKDGNIQYLVVQTREPFTDEVAIQLIFTEKNPASSKKPEFDAAFKELGSALILSIVRDGKIFGCDVAHTAHSKSPFTALGQIAIKDFKLTDTHVSGRVSTGGELEAFGQRWEVDLTFSAPLPKGAFAAVSEKAVAANKPAKEDEDETPVATGPKLPVAQLPLPSAALEVEYKPVVEHIEFRADASVSAVPGDFSAKLKQQGWKESPGSLKGKNNAILKRALNGADLTIMVQPAGSGCTVKVFTEGLDWSKPPAAGASAAKPAKSEDADGVEAEANRLIKDALKQIPR